jgi:uncharacterized protein
MRGAFVIEPDRTTLIIPGLGDSGPDHWQTWLEARLPRTRRVTQADWGLPDLGAWGARIRAAIDACSTPPTIVAHSFGVLAAVQASRLARRVGAALLAAPADPAVFGYGGQLPRHPLPYPVILVASRDDPWMSFEQAALWSERWGARLVDAGRVAHINTDSGHGPWPLALSLLGDLQRATGVAVAASG